MKHLDDTNFEKELTETKGLLVVDFWAPWCMPCKMLGPILEELDEKLSNPQLTIAKINIDENQETASKFEVRSIPTVVFFKNGKEVERLVGLQPKEVLEHAIESKMEKNQE